MAENKAAMPASSAPQPIPAAFAFVPDHNLIRLIGRGSSGEVWLARNTLRTYRAVKIVYERTFRHKRPFEREFKGVQKFEPLSRSHDGLMDILQVGRNEEAGYFYCVMELADDAASGQAMNPDNYVPKTLAQEMARHKQLPVAECLRIGAGIASALGFLHGHGLIHRDVKPSNIVFVNGVPKLADIGLVTEMADAKSYVGTEGFIPPEGPGTVQADMYSLGKVLYEISTGKDRHDYPELPTRMGDAALEEGLMELNKVVLKACRTDPRLRYRSAAEMVQDFLALERGETVRSGNRSWRLWLGAGVVLAMIAAFLVRAVPTAPSVSLINVDFGGTGVASKKTGFAATGLTRSDYWNYFIRSRWVGSGEMPNLKNAEGRETRVGLKVDNASGVWDKDSTDPMYHDYIYPINGGNVRVVLNNLPLGHYDVYVYGWDGRYDIESGGVSFGSYVTCDTEMRNPPVWQEGVQYVVFSNVVINATWQPLAIIVTPGAKEGYAVISGFQIRRVGD